MRPPKVILLALALAVLVLALVAGIATATELQRVQAETQDNAATTRITDANAFPAGVTLNALRYDDPTTITYPVTVAAGDTVQNIIVRSRANGNNSQAVTINILVDGTAQAGKSIGKSATAYQDRSWPVNISGGTNGVSKPIGVRLSNAPGSNKMVTDYLVIDGTSEPPPPPPTSCPTSGTVVDVNPGDDLDAKANAAGAGATIKVHGPQGTFYTVDDPIDLEAGQSLIGDAGTITQVGPANNPNNVVGIRAANTSMSTLLRPQADDVCIEWLDIDVNGAQKAMMGLNGGPNVRMIHVDVHEAQASGVGQYRGRVLDSEIYGNGTNPTQFDGTVAGIKCNFACEVARSYVHDNPGNGIWCDVGCQTEVGHPNGFYIHSNVAGDNGRHGIFYENAPRPCVAGNNPCNDGDPVSALITGNYVYGNGKSGVSVSDTADGEVSFNILGKTIGGTLDHNAGNVGIELHSSGDPTRGVQKDAFIHDNQMNGEIIDGTGTDRDGTPNTGCDPPDNGNVCTNNA